MVGNASFDQKYWLNQADVDMNHQEERSPFQAQLAHVQQAYDDLYHTAPVGYYVLNEHGVIVDVNRMALEQLGVAQEDVLHRLFQEYIWEDDADKFTAFWGRTFAAKTPETIEIRVKKRLGTYFVARLSSSFPPVNEAESVLCRLTLCDITELSQARDTLLRREGEIALFNRVSQVLSSSYELDHILVVLMEEVRRLLEVTACSIWLIDQETQEIYCRQAIGPHRDTVVGWRMPLGQGIVGWVIRTGQSLIVPDTWGDERHFNGIDRLTGHPLRSILTVPMCIQRKVIGAVQVLDSEPNRFTATDQSLQELLATMASMAIENARVYEEVRQDLKTRKILFHELNYRLDAALATIIRLFSTVRRHSELKRYSQSKDLMTAMLTRMKSLRGVYALLAEFEWSPISFSELTTRVIQTTLESLSAQQKVTVEVSPSSIRISPQQADSIGLVLIELVTNTVSYGMPKQGTGKIIVHIARIGEAIHFEFRDNGPGWPEDVLRFDRHRVGLYIIQKIVRKDLKGKLELSTDNGAVAEIRFKTPIQSL